MSNNATGQLESLLARRALLCSFWLLNLLPLQAQEVLHFEAGENARLPEARVWLPDGFEENPGPYPVMVVLNSNRYAALTYHLATELARSGQGLPLVVIGLDVPDNNYWSVSAWPYRAGQGPQQAMGDTTLSFLEHRLFPVLEQQYGPRLAPYRILAGHGDAGYFTLSAMMLRPHLFDAYLAAAPTIHRLVNPERAYRTFLVGETDFDGFLYLTNGFGDQPDMMETLKLARLLKAHSIERPMAYHTEMIEEETNAGIMQRTLYQGLQTLFGDLSLPTMLPNGGPEAWWERKQELIRKYGYDPLQLTISPRSIAQEIAPLKKQTAAVITATLQLLQSDTTGRFYHHATEVYNVCAAWQSTGHADAASALAQAALTYYPESQVLQSVARNQKPDSLPPAANAYGKSQDLERGLAIYLSFDTPMRHPAIRSDNGALTVAGIKEEALQFDGQEHYLELGLPALDKHQGSVSFSAWIKVDELRRFDRLLGKSMDGINKPVWQFGLGPLGDLQWGFSTYTNGWKDYWINHALPEDEWVHLVAVADQSLGQCTYYVNGEQVGQVEDLWPFPASQQPVLLGCNFARRNFFKGAMDEVRLYYRALSPAEAQALASIQD
ncbi:LamG-like jellyroll fold domain-containing protein [Phaeodactylibacter xiamenensis]|uniref:LamG-like jellyroll fold domain-containing protein n=1 Tax=Phaeodactylibacter xiamenensis TaxID=1524460 RepID=UPI003CCBACFD